MPTRVCIGNSAPKLRKMWFLFVKDANPDPWHEPRSWQGPVEPLTNKLSNFIPYNSTVKHSKRLLLCRIKIKSKRTCSDKSYTIQWLVFEAEGREVLSFGRSKAKWSWLAQVHLSDPSFTWFEQSDLLPLGTNCCILFWCERSESLSCSWRERSEALPMGTSEAMCRGLGCKAASGLSPLVH